MISFIVWYSFKFRPAMLIVCMRCSVHICFILWHMSLPPHKCGVVEGELGPKPQSLSTNFNEGLPWKWQMCISRMPMYCAAVTRASKNNRRDFVSLGNALHHQSGLVLFRSLPGSSLQAIEGLSVVDQPGRAGIRTHLQRWHVTSGSKSDSTTLVFTSFVVGSRLGPMGLHQRPTSTVPISNKFVTS